MLGTNGTTPEIMRFVLEVMAQAACFNWSGKNWTTE